MKVNRYLKAIVAAVIAGAGSLSAAMSDSTVTGAEWVTVLVATLGALGITYVVPNKKP